MDLLLFAVVAPLVIVLTVLSLVTTFVVFALVVRGVRYLFEKDKS